MIDGHFLRNALHWHRTLGCIAILVAYSLVMAPAARAGSERLLATGGVMQVEGSGGGGLTPWALIAGLGTDRELGASADCTYVKPQHFALWACGVAVGIHDRLELSFARQRFDLDDIAPGHTISQNIFGAKLRILGDAVYDQDRWYPQLSAGLQYKKNLDYDFIPVAIGARHDSGTDVYLTATKLYLAGPLSRTWLVSATLRATKANQFGILGFGGDRRDSYSYVGEASAAVFLTDWLVGGAEYRKKPSNLSAFDEGHAHDVFLAWFPSKYLSLTVAYLSLGDIATHPDQHAWYLAAQTGF